MFLRQSTSQVVRIGPFLDSTDAVTPETGLTIANTDIDISKDGGAFASKNSGGATVDGSNGWYSMTLDTTDTNTVGVLEIEVTVAGSVPVWKTFYVVEEAVYDAMYAAGAVGPFLANANGSTLTAIDLPNQTMDIVGNITGNLSGSVGSVTGAVGSVTGSVGSVTGAVGSVTGSVGSVTGAVGSVTGSVGSISGVTFPTNFADMAITVTTGQVTVGTNNDKSGYSISGTKTTLDSLNDIAATDIVSGGAINTSAGAVSNVTLVATTTTNTDMRGTDGANTVAPDNASISAILTDTGTTLPAQISALNDIAATDIVTGGAITTVGGAVSNVTLVGTTTTNTDMRGTDGANTVAPDNASIALILTDTGTTLPAQISGLGSAPTATANAEALLKLDLSTITGEADRSVINAIRFLRNKWTVSGGTLNVYKENDITVAWTGTVSSDAAADPVTGNDPA